MESPSFETDLFEYFETAYEQVQAALATYPGGGFTNYVPTSPAPPLSAIQDFTGVPGSTLYTWAAFGVDVRLRYGDGSRVLVSPAPLASGGDPALLVSALEQTGATSQALTGPVGYFSPWTVKYDLLFNAGPADGVRYEQEDFTAIGNDFYMETLNPVDILGGESGDVLLHFYSDESNYSDPSEVESGTYYDGGGNLNGTHDVFVANLGATTTAINWDLRKSITEEADGDPDTMGGVILTDTFGREITVKNVEAAYLVTGSADDYLVGGVYSDSFLTGAGDDIVRLPAYLGGRQDLASDYVRLGAGLDVAVVELGDVPAPLGFTPIDYVFGGKGADHLYIRNGEQGLRYDFQSDENGTQSYLFGGTGIGSDASHDDIASFLDMYVENYDDRFGVYEETALLAPEHILLLNGGPNQGQVQSARDIEYINVYTSEDGVDGTGGGTSNGDDLVVFMTGATYDGGGGIDTFAADFTTNELYTRDRGGLDLRIDTFGEDPPPQLSTFGDTVIENFERLHVHGTTVADLISGGRLDDFIHGGDGPDFLFGGVDTVADTLLGGDGNDGFLW